MAAGVPNVNCASFSRCTICPQSSRVYIKTLHVPPRRWVHDISKQSSRPDVSSKPATPAGKADSDTGVSHKYISHWCGAFAAQMRAICQAKPASVHSAQ